MSLYIINYEFEHKIWSAYFPSESWEEAQKRLAALKATGEVFGAHIETHPEDVGVTDNIIKAINTGRY